MCQEWHGQLEAENQSQVEVMACSKEFGWITYLLNQGDLNV